MTTAPVTEHIEPALKNCLSCGDRPTLTRRYATGVTEEYDNALVVSFIGGYAMFFDDLGDPAHHFVLCHDCAHRLFDDNPWLKTLFNPARSHSHSTDYHHNHPDHIGWDYDNVPDDEHDPSETAGKGL